MFISFWMLCFKNNIKRKNKMAFTLARIITVKMFACMVPQDDFKWHFSFPFTLWHFLTFTNKMDPPIGNFISISFEQNNDIDLSRHEYSIWLTNIHYDKLQFRCSVSHWINTHMCTFITTDVTGITEYFINSTFFLPESSIIGQNCRMRCKWWSYGCFYHS